jgi:hypothetical protein
MPPPKAPVRATRRHAANFEGEEGIGPIVRAKVVFLNLARLRRNS